MLVGKRLEMLSTGGSSLTTYGDGGGALSKTASTCESAPIWTEQSPDPLHAPPQRVKLDPAAGVAVRLTREPSMNDALQVDGQSIPDGLDVTRPSPETLTVSVRFWAGGGSATNVAQTSVSAFIERS